MIKRICNFGNYLVVEQRKGFVGVYYGSESGDSLMTHKSTWRSAVKLAKMLEQAYQNGQQDMMDFIT
ncbi:hypothetical protein [Bacillus sp. Marseille-P3800]|uniref:hypothetical protein n=1 Tax=Bacillus sp. Marseille-P3800 TaxID=2014782 RepID=UPI000C07BD6D|nr:hypothetical protein [Bacillus sp. Marseille-P3800]